MKKKLLLILTVVPVLVCLLALCASAANPVYEYNLERTVALDDGTEVRLYDESGNALTWYLDGAELKSMLTTEAFNWNSSGWLEAKGVTAASVVVLNLQDKTLDETAFSNYGINVSFRNSTNLEYVLFQI